MRSYLQHGGIEPLDNNLNLVEENFSNEEIRRRKASYVIDFIMKNLTLFRKFNGNHDREITLKKIFKNLNKEIHDTCIVLRINYEGRYFLLTGDATTDVFERLIDKNTDISAHYLKVPHHGNRHNMNREILDKITPEIAIISHNNHKRYNHPHLELLKLLNGKIIMLTNDVVKNNITYMEKVYHLGDTFVDIL